MLRCFYIFLFLFLSLHVLSSPYDPTKLEQEMAILKDEHKYVEAIKKLDSILNNKGTSAEERFTAFIQKSLIYKRLYNYENAIHNLNEASKVVVSKDFNAQADTRLLVERIFVYFDLNDQIQFEKLFKEIEYDKLDLLDPETLGFFYTLLGVVEQRKKNYKGAEKYFDDAIVINKAKSPRHLPNVYRAKMGLYEKLDDHEKVYQCYDLAKKYANEYNMDYYKIAVEATLVLYYANIKDYEKAFFAQKRVDELRTKYNANNHSGKLATLEKELLNQRKSIESHNQKIVRNYLIFIAVVLVALVIALVRLYRLNQQKRRFMEQENMRMRRKLWLIAEADVSGKGETKLKLSDFSLSKRHLEIIELVRLGKTNKEIGVELYISENTVKYHLKLIYEALGIDNRGDLKSSF